MRGIVSSYNEKKIVESDKRKFADSFATAKIIIYKICHLRQKFVMNELSSNILKLLPYMKIDGNTKRKYMKIEGNMTRKYCQLNETKIYEKLWEEQKKHKHFLRHEHRRRRKVRKWN